MNKSESIVKIASALLRAQQEMGNATKDSRNPFFKSTYATLNAIREATLPALNKHGIAVLQPMKLVDGRTVIETILLHESGEWVSSETPVVVSKLNDPQAEGSGQSYARRYGLQSLLNIGAEDDDAEAGMGRKRPQVSKALLESRLPPSVATLLEGVNEGVNHVTLDTSSPGTTASFVAQVNSDGGTMEIKSSTVEPLRKSSFKKPTKKSVAEAVSEENNGWT